MLQESMIFLSSKTQGFYVRHNALTVTEVTTIALCRRLEKGRKKLACKVARN